MQQAKKTKLNIRNSYVLEMGKKRRNEQCPDQNAHRFGFNQGAFISQEI